MADPLIRAELPYDDSDEYRPEPEAIPGPPAWQDGSFRIGIHTSIAGDIAGALDKASKLGANALQIFSASPRMWPSGSARIADVDAARFRARRAELGLGPLVIHDNYLINLASPERVMRTRSIQAFHDELIRAVSLGAGEIVLNSIDADGTKAGFDLVITRRISESVGVPVVASGGAGNLEHMAAVLLEGKADAVLAASIFHFGEYTVGDVKQFLATRGIPVRLKV